MKKLFTIIAILFSLTIAWSQPNNTLNFKINVYQTDDTIKYEIKTLKTFTYNISQLDMLYDTSLTYHTSKSKYDFNKFVNTIDVGPNYKKLRFESYSVTKTVPKDSIILTIKFTPNNTTCIDTFTYATNYIELFNPLKLYSVTYKTCYTNVNTCEPTTPCNVTNIAKSISDLNLYTIENNKIIFNDIENYQIYTTTGQILYSGNKQEFDISNLKTNIYYVLMLKDNKYYTDKLVKY